MVALKKGKVPVSTRALMQRLNRAMWDDDRMVKATRGRRAFIDLGEYYVLDWRINGIVETHVDLEELGKEYEVLKDYETWDTGEES